MSAPAGYTSPTGEAEGLRPHSVRILELQALRKNRPYSAANRGLGSANRYSKGRKEADRARPKLSQYRKEDLYDERMTLKSKANQLEEENLRLKTRIKFLEKEAKREETVDENSLLAVFKAQAKDLKTKLDEKEAELRDLKQSIKVTRATEVQVELKAYMDECTRLRRIAEESAQQLAMGVAPMDLQQRYLQLVVDYKALSREYRMVGGNGEEGKGRKAGPKEQNSRANNAAVFELREENVLLKDQNRSLMGELGRLQQIMVCPNCQHPLASSGQSVGEMQRPVSLLFHLLWARMKEVGADVQSLWHRLDSEMAGVLRPQEIEDGFAQLGIQLSANELTEIMVEMNPEQGTRVHFSQFEKTLLKHSLDPESLPSELIQSLSTLSWQCQVARVHREEIPGLLTTGTECSRKELVEAFQQVPFSLQLEAAEAIAGFLLHGEDRMNCHMVSVWMELLLPEWIVFTEEEETELDRQLMQLFRGKYDQFLELCKPYDPTSQQFIPFTDFLSVCASLSITLEGPLLAYLQVEFYSETKDTAKVPYQSVAQLYCCGPQDD